MPRILGEKRQSMAIHDPVSGSVITLYFRPPTSEERVSYQLSAFHLENGERRYRLGETRLQFGAEILLGFAPGEFVVAEGDGVMDLDPERHPDWKARLVAQAPDLVSYLGQQVFEGWRVAGRGEWE
jgi:hypothetical protein